MKIVFNTYPVAFQCPGGGEIQLLKSMEALQKKGVEVIKYDPWTTNLSEADVVHYFSVQGGSMNFCGYVHNQGIPLVISPIIWLGDSPEKYPVNEISELLRISDVICPNSHAEAKQLGSYFNIPEEKLVITHNGIDEIFTQTVDGELFKTKYNITTPFILCVGNIEPRKNQLNLIKAISDLNINLILIGSIRDQNYYNDCLSIADNKVNYIGSLDHHDPLLRSAYNACELFVLPSTLETPGLAALEAAACNTKIVITEEGSTKEYFQNTATYTNPLNINSIKESIQYALNSEIITYPNETAIYTWKSTADQLITAYNMATSNKN